MPFRNQFLAASYPAHPNAKEMVMLREYFSPKTEELLHWKIECENDNLTHCRLISKRWNNLNMCMGTLNDVPNKAPDGYYDHLCDIGHEASFWKIYAPTPSDSKTRIYSFENQGSSKQSFERTFTIGMATSDTQTQTITSSTTLEVEKSFGKFSVDASETIDASWSYSSTEVFAAKVTEKQIWVTKPKTKLEVYQLHGSYGGVFSIYADDYVLEETDLSSGTKKVTRSKKRNGSAKEEL